MQSEIKLISQACLTFQRNSPKIPFVQVPVVRPDDVREDIFIPSSVDKKNVVDELATFYKLHILIIWGKDCITSLDKGPLVFMNLNPSNILRYHCNLGRIIKLPSGLGKFSGPIHEFKDILKAKNVRMKCDIKNFNMQSDLNEIEKTYRVSLTIWQKCRQNFNHCKISRIRDGCDHAKKIHLHYDDLTNKLFLILDRKLYFRGYLKTMHNF